MSAPRVVSRFQNIDRNRIGKLQLAAIANARPTMKAMFCCSNRMPSAIATMPSTMVAIRDTRTSWISVARPRANTEA